MDKAHSVTCLDSSLGEEDDESLHDLLHVTPKTCKTKRVAKSANKTTRKTLRATNKNQAPVDNVAIDNAMAEFAKRNPDQPRRGRKPVREDIYISESLAKIDAMEERLKKEKETLSSKERDELRNKASALRSRVNRKLEARSNQHKLEGFKT